MVEPTDLLTRLDAIARSFALAEGAAALLAMGSAGLERHRLDRYSDLDFFAVVEQGYKRRYVADLGWLSRVHPIAYAFQNTADGYKLLFQDGIFCEMAVFETGELARIPRPQARIIWSTDEFDPLLARPIATPATARDPEWLLGEALTNLYVGLGRYLRGEKLSAMRFVQGYALDRVVELATLVLFESPVDQDRFSPERRIELRLPDLTALLPRLAQGYDQTPASAAEILFFLEDHFPVNREIAREIRHLLQQT